MNWCVCCMRVCCRREFPLRWRGGGRLQAGWLEARQKRHLAVVCRATDDHIVDRRRNEHDAHLRGSGQRKVANHWLIKRELGPGGRDLADVTNGSDVFWAKHAPRQG